MKKKNNLYKNIIGGVYSYVALAGMSGLIMPKNLLAVPVNPDDPGSSGGETTSYPTDTNQWNVPGDGSSITTSPWLELGKMKYLLPNHLSSASSKGEAVYSMDLNLPPALLQPSFNLAYGSSSGANAEMPYGWSFGGITEITRPIENAFDSSNEFHLSGATSSGVLALSSSSFSTHLASYSDFILKTSNEDHITARYNLNDDSWLVFSKDGILWDLSAVDDGSAPLGVMKWRVTSATDLNGNCILYGYDSVGRLTSIEYGGNSTTNESHLAKIVVNYTTNTHSFTDYSSGILNTFDKVAESVDVYARSSDKVSYSKVRKYKFDFKTDSQFGQVLLSNISELGYSSETSYKTLQLASFSYSEHDSSTSKNNSMMYNLSSSASYSYKENFSDMYPTSWGRENSRLIDFNGDGLLDSVSGGFSGKTFGSSESPSDSTWGVTFQEYDSETDTYKWGQSYSFEGPKVSTNETFTEDVDDMGYEYTTRPRYVYTTGQMIDVNGDFLPDVIVSNGSTTWDVYYNTGDVLGVPFDGPYEETAPWLYSGLSYAMDADNFPTWTTSNLRELVDINGDGWLDCFNGTNVYYHNGTKGAGWTVGTLSSSLGTTGTRYVSLTVTTDPVPDTTQSRQYYVSQTKETAGLYDINADGILDWVSATSTNWSVKLGNTQGFSSSRTWTSPLSGTSITKEGYPNVTYVDGYGYARSFTGWDQEVLQGLIDVNGDGYLDLVSFNSSSKGWYQNLGDGFSLVAKSLPGWWPDHLSSALVNSDAFVDTGNSGTVFSEMAITQDDSISDINRDGIPDASKDGVYYGAYPPPYLLIEVNNKKGLTSTMAYQPSSTVEPAGEPDKKQHLAVIKNLVKTISSIDSITGQFAKTSFSYETPYMRDDVFYGFDNVTKEYSLGGCTYLKQSTDYELSKYFEPLMTTNTSYTYNCESYSASLKNFLSSTSSKIWVEQYNYKDFTDYHYELASYKNIEYSSDYSSSKSYNIDYDYNEYADLISLFHNGGDDSKDAFSVEMEYNSFKDSSNIGPISRLSRELISGYDPNNYLQRDFQEKQWLYDNNLNYDDQMSKGLLTSTKISSGWYDNGEHIDDSYLEWTMERGSRGELKSVLEVETGKEITQTFAFGGSVVKTKTNNLGFGVTNTVNSRGLVTSVTNPYGLKKSYSLDVFDRVTQESLTAVGGSSVIVSATTFYDSTTPRYKKEIMYKDSGTSDSTSYNIFDGSGNIVQTWNQMYTGVYTAIDNVNTLLGKTLYTTHPVTKTSTFSYSGLNSTSYMKDRIYRDGLGNEISIYKDIKNSIGTSYVDLTEPRQSIATDEEGYKTLLEFDAHKRIQAVSALSTVIVGGGYATLGIDQGSYEYDPLNRLVEYTDPNNTTYRYSYDAAGRLRQSHGADIGTHTFKYKGMTRQKIEDSSGGYAEWDFDSIMRPISLIVSDPIDTTDGTSEYSWSYDSKLTGMLDMSTDPTGTTSYDYDNYGRAKSSSRVYDDGVSAVFSKTYDLLNRVSTVTYPSSEILTNTYTNGWLTKQTDKSKVYAQYTYDSYGRIKSWVSSKGPSSTRAYAGLFLDTITMKYGANTCTFDYSWYKNGLLSSKKDCLLSSDSNYELQYSYDAMRQLTNVKPSTSSIDLENFSYDSAGNLTSSKNTMGTNWTYDTAGTLGTVGNQIRSRTSNLGVTESYNYDLSGRKSIEDNGSKVKEYVYDGLSRLRAVYEDGLITLALDYDANNNILRRADSDPFITSSTNYTYSFENWRYEENGGLTTENIMNVMSIENGSRRWLLRENDGNVAIAVNDSGSLLGSSQFAAYGTSFKTSGDSWDLESFHGSTLEDDGDLFSMGQRHLGQKDGTWLQPEPLLYLGLQKELLSNPKLFATYRYSANNPMVYSDLTGFAPELDAMGERPKNSSTSQTDERREGVTQSTATGDAANEEADEDYAHAATYNAEPIFVKADGTNFDEVSLSLGPLSLSLAKDEYDQSYFSIGLGPSIGSQTSVCILHGEVTTDLQVFDNTTAGDPGPSATANVMTGWSATYTGSLGFGIAPTASATDVPDIGYTTQAGMCSGTSVSESIGYTWLLN